MNGLRRVTLRRLRCTFGLSCWMNERYTHIQHITPSIRHLSHPIVAAAASQFADLEEYNVGDGVVMRHVGCHNIAA